MRRRRFGEHVGARGMARGGGPGMMARGGLPGGAWGGWGWGPGVWPDPYPPVPLAQSPYVLVPDGQGGHYVVAV